MRFHFTFELENEKMDMDYRRKILSFLKYSIEKSDKEFYEKIYSKGQNVNKDFVMSVFFVPDTKISKDSICVKSKKMIINFSTPDSYTGIQIYNAMCRQKFIWYRLSDGNALRVVDINAEKEKLITQDKAVFKLLSPLVIRDHDRNTGKDWFYTFEDSAALDIIKRNMQKEFEGKFSRDISYDIKQLKIKFINCRKVIIRCYELQIPCTLGVLSMEGEQYLLQYLYQRGIGSKKAMCFGLLELL